MIMAQRLPEGKTLDVVIDAFCCEGGATRGYQQAGYFVVGIDSKPRKRYIGNAFYDGDAFALLPTLIEQWQPVLIAGSPPCQRYTKAQQIQDNEHPDLVPPWRKLVRSTGVPYVIENVKGSPLIDPVELCGCMFPELGVYRERLFETSFPVAQPAHQPHTERITKMGRPPRRGERMHVVGNFSGVAQAKAAMGIDWMTRDGLREAIPPAYTRWIAEQFQGSHTSSSGAK